MREELATADGRVFSSGDAALVAAADGSGPSEEHIDITVPREAGRDSLALLLDMRSSLLSTTIFYDEMLARHGARSLDWVGHDLSKITTVAQVARWYTDHFGLRVSVRDGDDWKPIVRMMDFGPTAWRTVAAVIPHARRLRGDSIRLRLSFVTDEFRIDRVATTWDVRPVEARTISAARVTESGGMRRDDVRDFIRAADDRRLVTSPGDRFFVDFDVGRDATPRTFLVAVDGYYVEWVRPAWIRSAADSLPFSPRTTTQEVLRAWVASRESLGASLFPRSGARPMRHGGLPALGVLTLLVSGCVYTGGSPSKSALASSPEGVAGVVRVATHVYEGELLTVTKADLTMRTSDAVVVIPYSQIERGGFSAIDVGIAGAPSPTHLDQLRYASRFPYGIPDAAMKAILSKIGRSAPDTARAR